MFQLLALQRGQSRYGGRTFRLWTKVLLENDFHECITAFVNVRFYKISRLNIQKLFQNTFVMDISRESQKSLEKLNTG